MNVALPRFVVRHALLIMVVSAMLALALISLTGMSISVMVGESLRGNASVINHAGALRRLAHRAASLAVAEAGSGGPAAVQLDEAIADFERQLTEEELLRTMRREPGGLFAATYRGVESAWRQQLKPQLQALRMLSPRPAGAAVPMLLREVDGFVDQLNLLVHVLERETEARIRQLSQILAASIVATLAVIMVVLWLLRKTLFTPLHGLLVATRAMMRGDYAARVAHVGDDELGRVGAAFNLMASEIAHQYQDLERLVAAKTLALQRSNRSLELLYHAIDQLYQAPADATVHEAILCAIEQRLEVTGCEVWIEADAAESGLVLAVATASSKRLRQTEGKSGLQPAAAVDAEGQDAEPCSQRFALRDREHCYGKLCLRLPHGRALEDWQRQLVEALSRHIGSALGAARRSQQDRLLVLQEERSAIARELHDSLAQSLSYMKIQVSLLQRGLAAPARLEQAQAVVDDLRSGLNEAYRQLRELLVSFRLELEGDLASLLQAAVAEYGERGGVGIELVIDPAACRLSPNQEVHVLQIVREALSNMVRHAHASRARVALGCSATGTVSVLVEDDGIGVGGEPLPGHDHHGLAIMRERARQLGGVLEISAAHEGGTRISLRFEPGRTGRAAESALRTGEQ